MKKATTIRALAVSVGLIATLWPTSAMAHLQKRTDPDDTLGKLDIVGASFDHGNGKITMTSKIASPWTKADLYAEECEERNRLSFGFDTEDDGSIEYTVEIYVNKQNRFDSDLYDYGFSTYRVVGDFGTITKTKRSVSIKFPDWQFEFDDRTPRWAAYSGSFSDANPCDDTNPKYFDQAPDDFGWFRHKGFTPAPPSSSFAGG